jgi:YidC/Oxa1 family membrane protein insertase
VAVPKPAEDPTADAPAALRDRATVLRTTPRVPIATPSLRGSVNLTGARIDDLVLTRHTQDMRVNSPPVRLLSPGGAPGAYFAQFGWTGEGAALPGPNTRWTATGDRLAPGRPLRLQWDNGQGQLFAIDLSVDENYMFTARQSRRQSRRRRGRGAALPARQPCPGLADPDSWTLHIGPVGRVQRRGRLRDRLRQLQEEPERRIATTGGWIGFTDKYWLTALVPDQAASTEASFRRTNQGGFQADATPAPTIVAPAPPPPTSRASSRCAKEIPAARPYAEEGRIPLFERAIDWGGFRWFMKPIFYLLDFLFSRSAISAWRSSASPSSCAR